ncbi:MAG: methyltransferase [DPANN group archaeon]|nr:methyltransferase [DPANN group archaeon]
MGKNIKLVKVKEGAAEIFVPKVEKITSRNEVFYNPAQVVNRDISVLLASCLLDKNAAVIDLLSASGVRAIRFAKEVGLKNVYANDANPAAVRLIKKNAKQNKVKLRIYNMRAHEFFATRYKREDKKFDYIDIDPFGTPVPFLDAAVKALNPRGGILAITATDTAALCGSAPAACLRKYGAVPLRNELMHELGVRILLKKIIEVSAQYDLALTPIFVHSTLHYVRVYLQADEGAGVTDKILEQVGFFQKAGPMWLGRLWDEKLAEKMQGIALQSDYIRINKVTKEKITKINKQFKLDLPVLTNISGETVRMLNIIREESKINSFGFYDLATFKLKQVPKISDVIAGLHAKGFRAARTHFSPTGIRTNADLKKFKNILKI